MLMAIKAVIFDYFGVIESDSLAATYRHIGGDPDADAQFIADTIYAANSGRIPGSRWVFAEKLGISVDKWMHERRGKDPDILKYILELRKTYKTGLLSNIGRGGLRTLWGDELEKYFDAAIASGDVGLTKPDPEIFAMMADRLGIQPDECIMIDDNPDYCEGARAAGMIAIQFQNLHQAKHELQRLLKPANPVAAA
jgi:putative hydrolase of the HAD superfamily